MPLCSSPMWGSALVTVSPSSWSTSLRKVEEIVICICLDISSPEHTVSRGVLGPKIELNIPHKLLRQLESTSRWWRLQRRREMLNEA